MIVCHRTLQILTGNYITSSGCGKATDIPASYYNFSVQDIDQSGLNKPGMMFWSVFC